MRNEAGGVAPLIDEIRSALDGRYSYEVICVDDGSDDGTAERLGALRRGFPGLRVLRHERSCGQSTAILTGVRAARAPWIVTLDGDGQNDPADIPKLLAALADPVRPGGLKMVCGHRRQRRDTWLRRMSSRVANAVRGWFLADRTPDTGCGLKVVERETYLALPYFDHMHRFLPALVQRQGGQTVSVEVNHRPRACGQSKYGLFDRLWVGIVDLIGVAWLRRRARLPVVQELE
jgi:dolichol-phosphate mannosyltransferase